MNRNKKEKKKESRIFIVKNIKKNKKTNFDCETLNNLMAYKLDSQEQTKRKEIIFESIAYKFFLIVRTPQNVPNKRIANIKID